MIVSNRISQVAPDGTAYDLHMPDQNEQDLQHTPCIAQKNGVRELIRHVPTIQCPALVMTSENDSGSRVKMSHDIAAEIDNSSVTIVPRLQHLGLMQQPELFSRATTDFLQNTYSQKTERAH